MFKLFIVIISVIFGFGLTATVVEAEDRVSCPVPGGKVFTHSYQGNSSAGHCGGSYGFSCYAKCPTTSRRAKAIDVKTEGKDVVLPEVNGQVVNWKLTTKGFNVIGGEGGGLGHTFEAKVGSDMWYLDMLHLEQTTIGEGESRPSGTKVAKSVIAHVHMTVGKNLKGTPIAATDSDCDPGWLPSEFMCDGTPAPASAQNQPNQNQSSISQTNQTKASFCTKVGNPSNPNPCAVTNVPGSGVPLPEGFPFYCQGDPRWANRCAMSFAGCGPTSMAMTLSYFGVPMTPAEVDEIFNNRGNPRWRLCGNEPSYMEVAVETLLPEQGFEVVKINNSKGSGQLDLNRAQEYLNNGYLIIGSVYAHIFVIDNVNPAENAIHLRDPARCGQPEGYWHDNQRPWGNGSWWYAYAVKKVR